MRTTIAAALLAAALLLAARPAAAQATPEEVADRYFRATQRGDWPVAAAMMHPQALADFKRMLADLAVADDEDEEFPRLFGLHTGEVDGMPPAQLYARVVSRIQSLQEGLDEMLKDATFAVLGHVVEGDTAHVVYRLGTKVMGAPVSQTGVVSMRRDGGEWKPLLNADLQNLFAGIKAAVAEPAHSPPVPMPRR